MSQIGTLLTGAGNATVLAGRANCPAYILLGTVDSAMPCRGLTVEVDGQPFIQITSLALLDAFAKWQMEFADAGSSQVGIMLKIATGQIDKNTTITLTNNGATTPAIFGFSDARNGSPLIATPKTVNAQSNEVFRKFSALMFETPANISNCEIVFADGHKDTLTPAEMEGLFVLNNQSEQGLLGGVLVLDNTAQNIVEVKVNTNAGAGGCTVLNVKLPDAAFQELKRV